MFWFQVWNSSLLASLASLNSLSTVHEMPWAAAPSVADPLCPTAMGATLSPRFPITHVQFLSSHSFSVPWITFYLSCPSQSTGYYLLPVPSCLIFSEFLSNSISFLSHIFLSLISVLFPSNWKSFLPWKSYHFHRISNNGKGADGGHLHKDQPHISTHGC